MRNFLFLFISLIMIGFVSCSNDNEEYALPTASKKTLKFIFEEIEYASSYVYAADSTFIFENKYVGEIYNSLKEYPELCGLVIDNDLYYFKTQDAMSYFLSSPASLKATTLHNTLVGVRYTFYENYQYKGERMIYQIGNYDESLVKKGNNSYLDMYFYDKSRGYALTSLDIYVKTNNIKTTKPYTVGVTLHDGFSKYTFTFMYSAPTMSKGIRGLGDYLHPIGGTWNDKAFEARIFVNDVPGY